MASGSTTFGIDVERQHAVAAEAVLARPVRARGLHARQRAAEQLAHQRKPRAFVLAEGADGAGALAAVARARGRYIRHKARAGRRSCLPSLSISASAGSVLPPWLATNTLPSATTEVAKSRMIGDLPGPGHADGEGCGRQAPLAAAEGRDQHAARSVDEVHGDEAGLGRHLGPVADPADMPAVAQGHHATGPSPCISRCRWRRPAAPPSGRSRGSHRPRPAPASRSRILTLLSAMTTPSRFHCR